MKDTSQNTTTDILMPTPLDLTRLICALHLMHDVVTEASYDIYFKEVDRVLSAVEHNYYRN